MDNLKESKYLSDEEMIALVHHHLETELSGDWEGVSKTFSENEGYLQFGATKMKGRQSIASYYRFMLSGISAAKFEEEHIMIHGNIVMVEGRLSGIHSGFSLGLPATGKRFEISLAAIFEVASDGKLLYEKVFIDSHSFLHELGFKFHPANPINLLLNYIELLLHPITLIQSILYPIRRFF